MTTSPRKPPLIKKGLFKKVKWSRFFLRCFEIFSWCLLGLVAAVILSLSMEPWLNAATYLVGPDTPLPLLNLISQIPILGKIMSASLRTPVTLVGSALFLFFNVSQLTLFVTQAHLVKIDSVQTRRIFLVSAFGYFCETFVAVLNHTPYAGGWAGFSSDWPVIDPAAMQWGEIGAIFLLLFSFELFLWAGIAIIFALRTSRTKGKPAV